MLKPKDLLESLEKVAYSDDMLEIDALRPTNRMDSVHERLNQQQQLGALANGYLSQMARQQYSQVLADRLNGSFFSTGAL